MTTIMLIGWLISGVTSFLASLPKILDFIKKVFYVGEETAKTIYVIGSFIVHLVGGLISLLVTIYNHFKGA